VATMSPMLSQFFSIAVKFFSTVLETNLHSQKPEPVGKLMLESQSKTVNLLQLSVPSPIIFYNPLVIHQKLNLYMLYFIYSVVINTTMFLKRLIGKDSIF
jgi:hypothetical protein